MFDNCVTGGDGERDEMGMAMAMTMIFSQKRVVQSPHMEVEQPAGPGQPGPAAPQEASMASKMTAQPSGECRSWGFQVWPTGIAG